MLYHRIRTKDGNEELVLDPTAYSGCKILEKDVTAEKVAGCKRVKGRWKVDRQEHRVANLTHRPKRELVEKVLDLEDRLTKLECTLATKDVSIPAVPNAPTTEGDN